MSQIAVVTIIANNYGAYARTLMDSLEKYEPRADRYIIVVDSPGSLADVATPLHPSSLGIPESNLVRMQQMYDVMEYCTSLKAAALRTLLLRYETVVFVDPDTVLFAPFTSLYDWSRPWSLALSPHRLTPPPMDGLMPDEELIKRYGIFNLGFVAVRAGCEPFLDWWHSRLLWWGHKSPSATLYTDQRWIDLAPGYFPVHVIRDPSLNVAPWNIDERELSHAASRWLVSGEPLTLAHFSGIRPGPNGGTAPLFGPYDRILQFPDRAESFTQLCEWYAHEIQERTSSEFTEYAFARTQGRRCSPSYRRAFRRTSILRQDKRVWRLQLWSPFLPAQITESHTLEGLRSGFRSDLKRLRTSRKAHAVRAKLLKIPGLRKLVSPPPEANLL